MVKIRYLKVRKFRADKKVSFSGYDTVSRQFFPGQSNFFLKGRFESAFRCDDGKAEEGFGSKKPIVVYKAGKNEEVSKATLTHTESLTGEYDLYRAMFKQANIVEVNSAWEAAVVSKAFSMLSLPKGNKMCAMTFTAGPSIVAMDRLLDAGSQFPDLSGETKDKIRSVIREKTLLNFRTPMDLNPIAFVAGRFQVVDARIVKDK